MTSNQFNSNMATALGMSSEKVSELTGKFVDALVEQLKNGQVVSVQGFGNFELKSKAERKMYNPTIKDFVMIPGKEAVNFKMSTTMKARFNNEKN